MVSRDLIIHFLNEFLAVDNFNDKVLNGLEIIGKSEVNKVVFGVSPSLELFRKAVDANADMIILHHGIINRDAPFTINEINKQRLKILFDNNITVLAYHLPLDAHYDSGNNVQLMRMLGLEFIGTFAGTPPVGIIAEYKHEKKIDEIMADLDKGLNANSLLLRYGKDSIKRVAIVVGSAGSLLEEALEHNIDLFITGVIQEENDSVAKEAKINVIAAGHYNSEKLGIIALSEIIRDKFKVETQFIDVQCII